MENKRIKLSDIVRNEGQVAGLPSNPRQWTKRELEQLKKSLKETPELLEARGILVYPHEGKYIILGGNMRYTALSEMKEKDAPCIVVDPDTPADKLRELVVKDNGTFGSWDFDALANEWDDLPLTDWGVPAWEMEEQEQEESMNPYTAKIESPIYEIKGECPAVEDLYDAGKAKSLIDGIEQSNLEPAVKEFLKACSYRHVTIDFAKVAEYYAHADKETQQLMEQNALVIIDFNNAVANGFVRLRKDMETMSKNNLDDLGIEGF